MDINKADINKADKEILKLYVGWNDDTGSKQSPLNTQRMESLIGVDGPAVYYSAGTRK